MTSTFSEDSIKKLMVFVWRNALEASKDLMKTLKQPFKLFSSEKGSVILTGEGIKKFNEIISELKKSEEIKQNFSNKNLENTLQLAILDLLNVEENQILHATEELTNILIAELSKSAISWQIIVPIVNLQLDMNEICVGNVKFHKVDTREIYEKIKRIIISTKSLEKVKESSISKVEKDILPTFEGKICADVIVSAVSSERATEIGIEMVEVALDVLRFYHINPIFPEIRQYQSYIDINGRIHSDNQKIICLSNVPQIDQFSIPYETRGFLFNFTISNNALMAIQNDNFDVLNSILIKPEQQRTKIERNIVTAIHFCALSLNESDTSSIINCISSLESVLLQQRESKIDNLAERITFLIGRDVNERNWIFDETIRLYRIRSSIVHNGETDIRSSDITLLQYINYRSIVNLLNLYQLNNFTNTGDIIKWVRNQKFC